MLMQPQLMTLRRFRRLMAWWCRVRQLVRHAFEASAGWRTLRAGVARWRVRLRARFR